MKFRFAKMHGLGNDFVVFDAVNQDVQLTSENVRRIADRKTGVGCDQILVIHPATDADVDFNYQIYNSNGDEVEQCGNGARCIGRFIALNGLTNKTSIKIKTISGVYQIYLRDDETVTVNMGAPIFEPEKIPFSASEQALSYKVDVDGEQVDFGAVSMGNPHAVIQVKDINNAPIESLGPKLEKHSMFPNKANIGFMQVLNPQHIALRVFERHVGETSACGTGACAAVAVGQSQGLLDKNVTVDLPGGSLQIECENNAAPVMMTGPAQYSFEGSLNL
ncbi:MAG: diaminopimelate epimerase [Gammaproteobacteria bacterium]